MTKGVAVVTVWTGTGFGARWKTEKRAAILVAAMAMMARLKPLVGASRELFLVKVVIWKWSEER